MADDAFERALAALSQRERTAAELAGWLGRRGFERDEVESVVARLIETGAIDDERFAREFAADKRELRGWGPERIREALLARGIDRELVEGAPSEARPDQVERAIALLEGRGDRPLDQASRARALGFLARRGYESEIAYEAVRGLERRLAA